MLRRLPLFITLFLIAALALSLAPAPATAAPKVPRFERSTKCAFPVSAAQAKSKLVICGYVIVPELHAQTTGKTIKLAVTIYKRSTGVSPKDAIILLQGGPGGSSDVFARILQYKEIYSAYTAQRDVIVFDQRGIGHSVPALSCSSGSDNACVSSLQKKGINVTAYNTAESAADVNDIRAALAYDKLDIYGVSYGTFLAQAVMRDFPTAVRSVVLDSVVPLGVDPDLGAAQGFSNALTRLFDECASDVSCNNAYPDLPSTFSLLVRRLNATPVKLSVTSPLSGKRITDTVNGDDFVQLLHQGFYSTAFLGDVPKLLDDTQKGNYDLLREMVGDDIATSESVSDVVYNAVECSDLVREHTAQAIEASFAGVLPEIAAAERGLLTEAQDTCRAWPNTKFKQPALQPLRSDLPTLVIGSVYDPVTPPEYARQVAALLPNSYYVEMQADAHAAALSEPCAFGLMLTFLNNPTANLNDSCAARQHIQFNTP